MVDYLKTILGRAVLAAALGAPVGAVAQAPAPDQGQPAEQSGSGQQDAAPAGTATADPAVTQPAGLDSFLKARLLESDGRYREALDTYAQALKESPSGVEIRVRYASLLTQVGLVDTAVKTLDEVAEDELDSFGLRTRALALAQMATRQPEMVGKAEAALRAALEERPDDPNLQLSLAQIAHRQGRVEEAEAIIGGMRGQHGSNLRLLAYHASLLRSLGRSEDAAELYARCAEERFGECRDSLVELLVELGRPGEAGEALLSWLDDDDLDGMLRAAGLLSSGGRPAEALRVVRRVLEAEPESRRARSLEALLLASMGDHEQAALRFEKLLRKDPDNLELSLTFAWTQMRRGRLEDARKLVARAWETVRDPTSPEAVNCAVTAARIELATGHPLVAREWLERIRGATSNGADVVRLLAASYRDVEHWREGMSAMLRLQPQLPAGARAEALAYEAEFRLRLGDAQGVQRLQPLLQSDEIGEVLVALQVLQVTERWADVEREATAALAHFPDDRNLRFTLAAALERLDRF